MRRLTRTAVVAGATVAGAAAANRFITGRRARRARANARHVITVFRPIEDLSGSLPAPLADLGDGVDVEFRAAPGGRGTEIAVRARDDSADAGAIRRALRTTRSLLEVGEVLQPSGPPTTTPTWRNRGLRAATRHGREEGLL